MSGKVRLLVCEDNELIVRVLRRSLAALEGIEVVGYARTGSSALEQADRCRPDLVLMDLGLPELDGIEATRQIKAREPGPRVLAYSSHDDGETVMAAITAGVDGYCVKPATPNQLHTAILSVASGAAWLHASIASQVLQRAARMA